MLTRVYKSVHVYSCSWIQEFVGPPNHGHLALLNVMKDLLDCPAMPQHKNPKKAQILNRAPVSTRIMRVNGNTIYTYIVQGIL